MEQVDFYLTYKSLANPDFSAKDLSPLLKSARSFNSENSITGVLLMKDGQFIQYLEGTKSKVESLFQIIKDDARHSSVSLLGSGKLARRVFPDWSMAYEELGVAFAASDPNSEVFIRSIGILDEIQSIDEEHLDELRQFIRSS